MIFGNTITLFYFILHKDLKVKKNEMENSIIPNRKEERNKRREKRIKVKLSDSYLDQKWTNEFLGYNPSRDVIGNGLLKQEIKNAYCKKLCLVLLIISIIWTVVFSKEFKIIFKL